MAGGFLKDVSLAVFVKGYLRVGFGHGLSAFLGVRSPVVRGGRAR